MSDLSIIGSFFQGFFSIAFMVFPVGVYLGLKRALYSCAEDI